MNKPHSGLLIALVLGTFLVRPLACCVPDCSAEQAAVAAAEWGLTMAQQDLRNAENLLVHARNSEANARRRWRDLMRNQPQQPLLVGGVAATVGGAFGIGRYLSAPLSVGSVFGVLGSGVVTAGGVMTVAYGIWDYGNRIEEWKDKLEGARQSVVSWSASRKAAEGSVKQAQQLVADARKALDAARQALQECLSGQ